MKKRILTGILSFILVLTLLPVAAFAAENSPAEATWNDFAVAEEIRETVSSEAKNGLYMPDVTAAMSHASYWIGMADYPDALLADWDDIALINETVLHDPACFMYDLKTWPYEVYDGLKKNISNQNSVRSTLQSYYNSGVSGIHYDKDGNYYETEEEIWANILNPIIENAADPSATETDPVRYAICTKRTTMMSVPSDEPLWEEFEDKDNGNNWIHPIRVNEPLLVLSTSADGKYCLAYSIGLCSWIRTEDIAFCRDKEEWLAAWDLAPEKTLVVYADKIYTEMSYTAPETSKVMLTMGTCLELAEEAEYANNPVINRWAYNNHVVWLPVRKDDGSYDKVLALIGENREVNEGFLPVTTNNILTVAFNYLGDTYGWGGMLESEDCSGYMRDVYKCFGLEIAKNTSWQSAMPVYKQSLKEMSKEQKADYIRDLPPGAILFFNGHEMMYLGEENGKLYVISSVGSLRVPGSDDVINVRGGMINTLDVQRRNGSTWLENLHTALIPYYPADYVRTFPLKDEDVVLEGTSFPYTGRAVKPGVTVTHKDKVLEEGTDYTVSYENNTNAGTAAVVVTGTGIYTETVTKTFSITKVTSPMTAKGKTAEVKAAKVKKQNQTLQVSKVLTVKNAKGTLTYTKSKGNSKISINKKTGAVTVKKGLAAGTYSVTVKVKDAGNRNYKAVTKTTVFKIKVK